MRAARTLRRGRQPFRLPRPGMRLRLTLWYLVVLAIVFLVFGGILVVKARQSEETAQQIRLAQTASQLANGYSVADGLIHATISAPKLVHSAKTPASPDQAYFLPEPGVALFVDLHGAARQAIGLLTPAQVRLLQTVVTTSPLMKLGAAPPSQTGGYYQDITLPKVAGETLSGDYAAYITPIVSQGKEVGLLLVALPNTLNQTTASVVPALLVAGPVTLLVAALGGYWLAARALRPVRVITRAAQQISETDLSRRLRMDGDDELGELAATFDSMLARLEGAFQRQRQFTADASHELRTPLTIINLEVTRALAEPRTSVDYQRTLGVIQDENLAMSRLVDGLLTLARADAGSSPLRFAPLDLSDIALEAVERLSPLAQQFRVKLVVEALPEVIVAGDRQALSQAMMNLVENGIKYTAGVGSHVMVSVRAACDMDGATWGVASVSDDGPGIAAEHLPLIFDRFYRVDVARASGQETPLPATSTEGAHMDGGDSPTVQQPLHTGTGLGLAIAQWVLQGHGGEVRVSSETGAGATFELWLPAEEEHAADG